MAVTFQSQTGASGTGNFTPSYPSGVTTDDLIIIHVCFEKGSDVNFAGAGSSQWTWIDRADNSTNIGIRVGYLKYDGTTLSQINLSGGPKYTWTTARYDGQDTTSPIDQNANANGSSGNPNPPSITPTVSPTLAIICAGNKKAPTGTPPSGYTERWDRANTTDSLSWTYGAEKALSDTSAEDPGNVTASETEAWGAITFNVKEAAVTDRDVTCTTEVLTLTENAATVNKERGVNCSTEVLTLTENAATVNKQRGVNCSTEVLTLTENAATIDTGFTTTETAYFDASYSGPTDPDAVWTDDANAFDGSTSTEAETGTVGTPSTNELTGQGHTTSSAKWDNVLHARTRVYTSRTGTATGFWYLYDQAGSWQYSSYGYSNPAPTWSPWLTVEEKFGGWTKDDFEQLDSINHLSSGSGTVHSYRAEIEWTYAPNLNFSNYRIDASDAGPTDAQAVWTDDANAFDNIRPTFASLAVNNNGSSTNNALVAEGTNAPGSGPPISVVYARSLFTKGSYDSLKAEIYTDGKGELLGTIDDTDRFEWFELTAPSGGWTWAKVQALEAYLYGTGYVSGASVGRAYFVEVKVGYDGRRVDCSTEVITLTENSATVNASRDVNCTTEVLTFTEATATVNASRKVTCSTEVLTLTSNKAALFTATETVYMDASVSGPTDPDAAWTNDSNAFDGSTSTYAVTTTAGDIDVNELQGKGHTTVNAAWNTVVNSRARVYGHKVSGSLGRSLLWDGISVFNVYFIGNFPDSLGWSSWVPLFEPKPGWSQTVFDELVDTSYVTGTTPELRWYRTEVEWTYRTDLEFVDVYYFDASDEGPTDSQSVWTLESSAFDDLQTSNAAQLATGNNGSSTNNALSGGGTNAPASGGTIVACYARWAATKGDYAELHGEIYTNGKSELLETLSTTDNNVDPKDWIELAVPSGGWTWAKVQALEIYCYGTGHVSGSGSGLVRGIQIKVGIEPVTGRTVTCSTEVITLTENAATVNAERGVTTTTEVLTLTENAATVNKERGVNCATEVITLTEQTAAINRTRDVNCTTEVITLTENAATVNLQRGVNCTTEVITLTEQAATVARVRNVSCTTEVIALTENAASINRSRIVLGATEVITLTEVPAGVNGTRVVTTTVELTLLTEQDAAINRTRDVACTTEVITLTEQTATVNATRDVTCTTEVITLTENAATVTRGVNRLVSCTTEVITLTEQAATVNATRDVTCTTEVITLTENSASINAARNVQGVTESIILTEVPAGINGTRVVTSPVEIITTVENASSINRTRDVTCTTEVITLTENAATISRVRPVVSTTEVITITENTATVDASRVVTCVTEVITLTENAATVNASRVVTCATEVITLTENAATVDASRVVTSATEVITLTENAATVNATRDVTGATEVIVLTENAANVARGVDRFVTCTTEVITLTENSATINATRDVTCTTEVITLTENAATINASRVVTGTSEVITLTANAAAVNGTRVVGSTVELVLVAENAASVNASRIVTGVTEVILLTENSATVERGIDRSVVCTIEVITLTENAATVDASRIVTCTTEVITLTENAATVTRGVDRFITCTTEVITLTANAATILFERPIIGITEVITITTNPAAIARDRGVICETEVIIITTPQGSIEVAVAAEDFIWTDTEAEVFIGLDTAISTVIWTIDDTLPWTATGPDDLIWTEVEV